MPKYLVSGSYSLEGIKEIVADGGTSRVEAAKQLFNAVGGTVEAMYFAFGSDDLVAIVDVPNNITIAALSVFVTSLGALRPRVTPLLTAEEIDAAAELARSVTK